MVLSKLRLNEQAVVQGYVGEHHLHERLMELGIVPGTAIYVKRAAPFGDPIEVVVRGSCFSIRKEDAERILVETKK